MYPFLDVSLIFLTSHSSGKVFPGSLWGVICYSSFLFLVFMHLFLSICETLVAFFSDSSDLGHVPLQPNICSFCDIERYMLNCARARLSVLKDGGRVSMTTITGFLYHPQEGEYVQSFAGGLTASYSLYQRK